MRAVSDGALVRRARAGSAAAATELFERHWPMAWRVALAMTADRAAADDVAQVALTKAFSSLGAFDVARPFAPWLKRIVTRAALDHLRATPGWVSHDEAVAEPTDDGGGGGEDAEWLSLAVLALAHDRRVVVVLRYWVDLTVEEIASLVGVPPGTVASRLSRALADLRKTIEEGSHARLRQ